MRSLFLLAVQTVTDSPSTAKFTQVLDQENNKAWSTVQTRVTPAKGNAPKNQKAPTNAGAFCY
jgi:hypothetical protein